MSGLQPKFFQLGDMDLWSLEVWPVGTKVKANGRPWFGIGECIVSRGRKAIRWPDDFLTVDFGQTQLRELDLEVVSP